MSNIPTPQEIIDMVTSLPVVVLLTALFLSLSIIAIVFTRDFYFKKIKKIPTCVYNKPNECLPDITKLNITDIFNYFSEKYNYSITDDTSVLINKARDIVLKTKTLKKKLDKELVLIEMGISINKQDIVNSINSVGYVTDLSTTELEMIYRMMLFLSVKNRDNNKHLNEVLKIKSEYKLVERRLLAVALAIITENSKE